MGLRLSRKRQHGSDFARKVIVAQVMQRRATSAISKRQRHKPLLEQLETVWKNLPQDVIQLSHPKWYAVRLLEQKMVWEK